MPESEKVNRKRVVHHVGEAFQLALRQHEGFQTFYDDEEGRTHVIVLTTEGKSRLGAEQQRALQEMKSPGLFVYARAESGSVGVYAESLEDVASRLSLNDGSVALHFEETETDSLALREAGGLEVQPVLRIEEHADKASIESGFYRVSDLLYPGGGAITWQTFDLLERLKHAADPKKRFYDDHKEVFWNRVITPFKNFFRSVADALPGSIRAKVETENYLFSQILKNDYGRGGAWPYYWGAFYVPSESRVTSPQLYATVRHNRLECGFDIGDRADGFLDRFQQNLSAGGVETKRLLQECLDTNELTFGCRRDEIIVKENSIQIPGERPFEKWIEHVKTIETPDTDASVMKALPRADVLGASEDELIGEVVSTFKMVWPLFLLATEEEPHDAVKEYTRSNLVQSNSETERQAEHPVDLIARDTSTDVDTVRAWADVLRQKRQAIFYGPPGTGKTFLARHLARHLVGGGFGHWDLVQFHPSYAYEQFIEGLRPQKGESGSLTYEQVEGRFLTFCNEARACASDPHSDCVLIIDEINRANLSRVFGELMYLLEYRDRSIQLASGTQFSIPENVILIGTMNTADRSIALVDHALRRRFAFLPLWSNPDLIREYHATNETGFDAGPLIEQINEINAEIDDRNYSVGPSYFLRDDLEECLPWIWQFQIVPYLEEYFFSKPETVDAYRWENVKSAMLE